MVGRAADRDHVNQFIRQRSHRLVLLAIEVEVLNLLGGVFEAVAADELVVEVLLA